MKKCINLALHARVVVESIAVKVSKLRGVLFQSGASKRYSNIEFDKGHSLESHQALKTLNKKYKVFIINVVAYKHYLAFFMRPIEMRVKVAEICLILSFSGF